jgi:hypothetical protein
MKINIRIYSSVCQHVFPKPARSYQTRLNEENASIAPKAGRVRTVIENIICKFFFTFISLRSGGCSRGKGKRGTHEGVSGSDMNSMGKIRRRAAGREKKTRHGQLGQIDRRDDCTKQQRMLVRNAWVKGVER